MATVERSRRNQPKQPQSTPTAKKKSRAFRYGCLVMLVLLVVAGYFAPPIIGNTPLVNWILQSALDVDGTITVESASLDWFSPVVVENLEIVDGSGDTLLTVESVESEKPLIAMLLDLADLGRLHVVRPTLHVVAGEQDSNLEQVFATLLSSPRASSVAAQLEVTEGTLVIDDVPASRQFRIENVALDCTLTEANDGITLAASGVLTDARLPGNFKIDIRTVGSAKNETALASGKIDCQASAMPLELLQPIVRRKIGHAQLTGRLSTRLGGAWGEMAEGGETSVRGESLITDLDFAAASLGPDHIRLARVEMPCHVVQTGELVQVEQLAINCDLGKISLSGSAKMSDFSAANQLRALARENYELKGHVDLAKLAALLPATLRIREGTEITSGQVDLAATSRQQPDGMTWTGRVDASDLGAEANGRAIVWQNPLAVQFATRETKDGFVVDRIQCTSSFLQVKAAGSLDDLTASADFDLSRLLSELRQFSDLNHVQMAGHGQSQWVWKRVADDRFTAAAEFQIRGFQWITGQAAPWQEDNLVAKLDFSGQLLDRSIKQIDEARLTVESGGERLDAKLREAVSEPSAAPLPLLCSWRGQLAHWAPRLENLLGVTGWDLAGQGAIDAQVRASAKTIEVQQCKADFAQFQLRGHNWFVNEPTVSLALVGKADSTTHRVELTQGKLSAGTAVAVVNAAVLQSTADGWTLDGGTAQFVAELGQLYRWQHDPRAAAAWQVSGKLTGEAALKHETGATSGQVNATVDQLQVVEVSRPAVPGAKPAVWQERQATIAARGSYQHASEHLQLEKLQVVSDAVRCDASGAIATSDQGGDVDLKGTIQYDWQQLSPLLRPYVGQGVQVAGKQTREFAVHGPLSGSPTHADSWRAVSGEAAVGWTGMNVYGLVVGRGDVAAKLANGQVRTQPIDVQISEGRLTVSPLVQFSPAPAEIVLGRGPLLTDVHLSPELCSQGLKYVAPILAGATVADGRFSIALDGGLLPLSDVTAGDVGGRMAMRAQVTAGPVMQEFMVLIKELTAILGRGTLDNINDQSGALLSIDDSNIEFRLVERRIYHRGLQFMIGSLPITTHGSVGVDESLAIIAEVPVQAKLFGIDLSLGALEGRVVQIPIGGTLEDPKLDPRAMQQLSAQMLQNTARGVLIDGVGKQLEKLERFLPTQP